MLLIMMFLICLFGMNLKIGVDCIKIKDITRIKIGILDF